MKLFTIGILLALTAQNGFAQTPLPTLKANMDTIKSLVTPLVKNVSDSNQNAQSAVQAGQVATIFGAVLVQVPTLVSALPEAQQAAAITTFKGLIQKEIDDATALQKAFLANDNATALTLLQDMTSLKTQGHSLFTH